MRKSDFSTFDADKAAGKGCGYNDVDEDWQKEERMKAQERLMKALNYEEPDRVPIDFCPTLEVYRDLCRELGYTFDPTITMSQGTVVEMPLEMTLALGLDCARVDCSGGKSVHSKKLENGDFINEWGVYFKKTPLPNGAFYYENTTAPLACKGKPQIEMIENYIWPDPDDPSRYEKAAQEVRYIKTHTDLAVSTKMASPVFEQAIHMRGFDTFLMDLVLYPDFANALMDKIVQLDMRMFTNAIQAMGEYVDVVKLAGEDLGSQDRMLMSLPMFRKMIKPHLQKLYAHARREMDKVNPQAKFMLHSCGSVFDLIPDLIECHVDCLDPVQPRAKKMDRYMLKKTYGGRMAFHGNIDTQYVLPFGTEEEIVEEVKDAIRALAPGGGYFLSTAHYVQSDVSAKNLLVMLEAAKKYGRYPIAL